MTTDRTRAARAWIRQQSALGRKAGTPVLAAGLASVAAAVAQAWCVAAAIGAAWGGAAGEASGRAAADAAPWLGLFAALALLRAGLGVLADRLAFGAGATARRRLRTDVLSRLLDAGPAALRGAHSGELTALVVDRVEALDGLFGRWLPASSLAVAGPALVALCLAVLDPVAAAVLAGFGLLVPVAMALAGLGAAAASQRQFLALSRLQARFLDRVRGISTVVLAGRVEREADALAAAARELGRRTMRVLRVAFLSSAALDLAFAAALVILALRAAAGVQAAEVQAGEVQAGAGLAGAVFTVLLVPEFFAPLRAFAAAYQDRLHAEGAAEAVAALPARPAPAPAGTASPPSRTVAASGVTVAFEDVRLTHDPSRGPVLDGLSFKVPAGETVVLAGPSGAGKTTVLEILLGFVRPDSGRVTINGADIGALVPQALSRLTAWIGQRPTLFAGTIRENIRFARPEATDAEVESAARGARVLAFAAGLPQGLDTPVGEGGYGLSGGQAQRVAIARAFLKDAPLLLLDEPTAHLDPATEADVLDSLRRLTLNRTVILATHSVQAQAFGGRRIDLAAGGRTTARGAA